MSNPTKFLRRFGALALGGAALVSGLAFTFVLNSNTKLPIKWPAGSIPLRIILGTGATSVDTNFNQTAKAATDLWNARMGSAQFSVTLGDAGSASPRNGLNELAFGAKVYDKDFDANVLAVTTGYSLGNERTESDTIFNTAYTWDSYRGVRSGHSGKIDLRRVAVHELGHALGLDHPDEASPVQTVSAIMNSHVGDLDTLADDDIAGVQSLYGPPGVPANNNFANATALGSFNTTLSVSGYNTNATKEGGEPNHANNAGGRSVWWRWTASASGNVTVDTRGSYSDTTLAIYTGSAVGSLNALGSSDDIERGSVQASSVTLDVVAGTVYSIAVDGFNNNDGNGADSAGIKLNLTYNSVTASAPTIVTQPSSATLTVGGNVSFSVTATGTDPLSYQWLFNGTAITGATGSSYSINSVQTANAGTYTVTVTNPTGSVTSAGATLTVNAATPPPTTTPPSSGGGGGGGGGGGAPSVWFMTVLAVLGLARLLGRRES